MDKSEPEGCLRTPATCGRSPVMDQDQVGHTSLDADAPKYLASIGERRGARGQMLAHRLLYVLLGAVQRFATPEISL